MFKIFAVISLIVIFNVIIYSQGKIFFVNENSLSASDENPGTLKEPLKTIQRGIDLANAGDTVLVMPGTYNEALKMKRSGNNSNSYIVIKSSKKWQAVIDGSNINNTKLIYWHGTSDGGKNKNYILFDGFEIKNAKRWAFWIQGDDNILSNLKIHNTGKTAVQLITGSHNIFRNNEIYNSGWNGISWESNNSGCGIRTDSNIVEHNFIHDLKYHVAVNGFPNEGSGNSIEFGGIGNIITNNIIKDCLEGIYLRYEKDFVIAGNLIVNIKKDGIFFHYDKSYKGSYTANGKIINNTIANCSLNGIVNSNAKDLKIYNNIFYENGGNKKYDIYWYPITDSDGNEMNANLYYSDIKSSKLVYLYSKSKSIKGLRRLGFEKKGSLSDPKFVDADSGNFMLKSNSPAVDAGINFNEYWELKIDINNVSRPQGQSFDMGAYEYVMKTN